MTYAKDLDSNRSLYDSYDTLVNPYDYSSLEPSSRPAYASLLQCFLLFLQTNSSQYHYPLLDILSRILCCLLLTSRNIDFSIVCQ